MAAENETYHIIHTNTIISYPILVPFLIGVETGGKSSREQTLLIGNDIFTCSIFHLL
jgi:hypothetical protein